MADAQERFVRKGLPLIDWLVALLSDQVEVREHAALMYQAMQIGVPDEHTDITPDMLPADPDAHAQEFADAVRAAVDSLGDQRASFVRRLLESIETGHREWIEYYRRDSERVDRVWGKLEARLQADMAADRLEKHLQRVGRLVCAAMQTKTALACNMASIVSGIVVNQLDHALLDATDFLDRWLAQGVRRHLALEAIARIGPPAITFLPRLLGEMDESREDGWWDAAPACAALARADADVIRGLVTRLKARAGVAANAALVLRWISENSAIDVPETVSALLAASARDEESVRIASLLALGEFGRDRPEVADRLARAIRAGTMMERGYAVSALQAATVNASIAVPLLIDAFSSFEEFDPDQYDSGEHARIADALAAYRSDAAPALSALLARMQTDGAWNRGVIECLAAIGPAARDAVPVLERAALESDVDDWRADDGYVAKALRAIAGETRRK